MKSPIQLALDFYDYEVEYYKNFISRRLLFSDVLRTPKNFEEQKRAYDIYEDRDDQAIDKRITETTRIGFHTGMFVSGFRFATASQFKAGQIQKNLPMVFGTILLFSKKKILFLFQVIPISITK